MPGARRTTRARAPTLQPVSVFVSYPPLMDPDRAGQLLAREREQIEQAIAELDQKSPEELAEQHEPGDGGSEDLYQKSSTRASPRISLPSSPRWKRARRHGLRPREPSASPPRAASRFPTSAWLRGSADGRADRRGASNSAGAADPPAGSHSPALSEARRVCRALLAGPAQ